MHAPEIGGQFFQQFAIAGQQFRRVEGMPTLQRMFAQHAGAEAVDGEDRRQVDFIGSHLQAPLQRLGAFRAVLQVALQHLPGQRRVGRFIFAGRQIDQACGQGQALTDALAQLLCGSVSERHRQDLADTQALLDHQTGEQRCQGEGLAGAGAGFDQSRAMQRQCQVRVGETRVDERALGNAAHAWPACGSLPKLRPSRTALKTTWLLRSRSA